MILTGFGPFGDVLENPTAVLINELKQVPPTELSPSCPVQIIGVLEVSTGGVDRFIESTQHLYSGSGGGSKARCCIHLGVDANATQFKLETVAYNNCTFRIPDAQGYQPEAKQIDPSAELEAPLRTGFDVDAALLQLQSEGHSVVASTDAGRYLCNYVFYRLLTELAATPSGPSAAFLHIPPVAAAGLTLDDLERGTKTAAAAFAPSSP